MYANREFYRAAPSARAFCAGTPMGTNAQGLVVAYRASWDGTSRSVVILPCFQLKGGS